jgi:hypothetical protein
MTPEQIAAGASCFQCLNEDQKRAAVLYLLDQFSSGGNGPFVEISGDTMTGRLVSPNINFTSQAVAPSAPASGFVEYADSTGRKSWIRASDGFTRTWDATLTANRVFTLPDATTTIAGLSVAQSFTQLQTFSLGASIAIGQTLNWNSDLILSRKSAANLQLGATDSAAPAAQTLSVQSVVAGTSNTAGANWSIKGSASTGSAVGGDIILQTTQAGSSGSSQNPFVTALTVAGNGFIKFGSAGANASAMFPFSGTTYTGVSSSGRGLSFYSFVASVAGDDSFAFTGSSTSQTSGTHNHLIVTKSFSPTSGTGVYNHLHLSPTINQTGGANGITRALYINPTLTAAADFRALEIGDGNVVLPKTVTAGGTTGAQTINKITGTVNFAAAATSLVVTNSYVSTSSIIVATVATNDATMKSVVCVAGSGSFTIYANAAATAETRVNFRLTN